MEDYYYQQSNQRQNRRDLKKFGIAFGLFAGIIVAFFAVYNRSIIEVQVDGRASDPAHYKLINQATGDVTEFDSDSALVSKHIPRGSYEVLVTQKDSSFFSIVSTKPLFGKTRTEGTLNTEKGREFVGNNPGPCMNYNQVLYTFSCGGKLQTLTKHEPADAQNPTVSQSFGGDLENVTVSSLFQLGGRTFALTEGFFSLEDADEKVNVLEFDGGMQVIKNQELTVKSPEQLFGAVSYGNGFLLYNNDLSRLTVHESPEDIAGKVIDIEKPGAESLSLQQLSVSGDKIAATFSNKDRALDSDDKNKRSKKQQTIVQLYDKGNTKSFIFDGTYYTSQLCAEEYICLVQDRKLFVYKLDEDKPKKIFETTNVYNVSSSGKNILVNRYDGVFELNPETKIGYVQYSYSDYEPCGLEPVRGVGYVLCLINTKDDKVAVLVNNSTGTDNIDKKILSIIGQPYVSNVSIYKNYVYISPDLGEPEYQEAIKGFGYDAELAKSVDSKLNALIDEIKIDRSRYTIVNLLK